MHHHCDVLVIRQGSSVKVTTLNIAKSSDAKWSLSNCDTWLLYSTKVPSWLSETNTGKKSCWVYLFLYALCQKLQNTCLAGGCTVLSNNKSVSNCLRFSSSQVNLDKKRFFQITLQPGKLKPPHCVWLERKTMHWQKQQWIKCHVTVRLK